MMDSVVHCAVGERKTVDLLGGVGCAPPPRPLYLFASYEIKRTSRFFAQGQSDPF